MRKLCQLLWPLLAVFSSLSWLTITTTIPAVNAAKILGLFAHSSESHFAVMRTVMTELARRKHNVTVYCRHSLDEHFENLQEIHIAVDYNFWHALEVHSGVRGGIQQLSHLPPQKLQQSLVSVGATATGAFLEHPALQQLLKVPVGVLDYDLIIVDLFYTEALLALGDIHSIPTVAVVSSNFENYMQHVQDQIMPVACPSMDIGTHMGFWQRLANTRRLMFPANNLAEQTHLITQHFGHFPTRPTINEIYAKLALILLNNHIPLVQPRPLLPNTIAAGGLHIRPPREIPWHLRRFLDEARAGVIYLNLGNEQLCADIPKEKLTKLFNVFGKRRERILWTCHDTPKYELPSTVMVQHVVPQSDLLAHPHVRVFVMNGDLISLQDGVMRHVPMLGVTTFRNEHENMALAEQLGFGIEIANDNLTEKNLNAALDTLLLEVSYGVAIRDVAAAFRDRPLGALETSMFWIDYVLRHNGGSALRTKNAAVAACQLRSYDLVLFYFLLNILIVVVLLSGAYIISRLLRRREQLVTLHTKFS